jgi:hypothetical protein
MYTLFNLACSVHHRVQGGKRNRGCVTASQLERTPQTTTLLGMVDRVKGGGTPQPSPGLADFTIMTECMPESGNCHSVYSVVVRVKGVHPPLPPGWADFTIMIECTQKVATAILCV